MVSLTFLPASNVHVHVVCTASDISAVSAVQKSYLVTSTLQAIDVNNTSALRVVVSPRQEGPCSDEAV